MNTKVLNIHGKDHLLVFNNRVLAAMEEKGISLARFQEEKPVTHTLELLRMMSESGARYAKLEGLGKYDPIDMDALLDYTSSEDYEAFQSAIVEVITGDRKVDAVPGKNGEAAPAEGQGN